MRDSSARLMVRTFDDFFIKSFPKQVISSQAASLSGVKYIELLSFLLLKLFDITWIFVDTIAVWTIETLPSFTAQPRTASGFCHILKTVSASCDLSIYATLKANLDFTVREILTRTSSMKAIPFLLNIRHTFVECSSDET